MIPNNHAKYEGLVQLEESIRDQISDLQRRLLYALAQRNAIVPIAYFPDEVLLAVFALLVRPAREPFHERDIRTASHVCHRWRSVISGVSSLWTEATGITFSNHTSTRFIEQRLVDTEPSPLSICIYLQQASVEEHVVHRLVSVLAPHVGRVHHMSVVVADGRCSAPAACAALALATSFPALSTLWLECTNPGSYIEFDRWRSTNHRDSFTALRSLTVVRGKMPPAAPLYTHLRHLSLTNSCFNGYTYWQSFPYVQFRAPNLELAEFADDGLDPPASQTSPPAPYHSMPVLARTILQSLSIKAPRTILRELFDLLFLPGTTVRVECSDPGMPALVTYTAGTPYTLHSTVIKVETTPARTVTLKGYADPDTVCVKAHLPGAPPSAYLTILDAFGLAPRETLTLDNFQDTIAREHAYALLHSLGDCAKLRFIGCATHVLATLFRCALGAPLPGLRGVEVRDAVGDGEEAGAALAALVERRRARGVPLARVVLAGCAGGARDAIVRAVRPVAGELVVEE